MSEINKEKTTERTRKYFLYMIFILMLVQILDSYATVFPGAIPSVIAETFLSGKSENVQNSIMAFASGAVSIGMYFLFFSHYLSDKLGSCVFLIIFF